MGQFNYKNVSNHLRHLSVCRNIRYCVAGIVITLHPKSVTCSIVLRLQENRKVPALPVSVRNTDQHRIIPSAGHTGGMTPPPHLEMPRSAIRV